jgi:uncharacterized protein YceH (UPF0502 family)
MLLHLDPVEARILGSLVEKSLTPPDQCRLSLNALVNACNQTTSREPVMNLDEAALRQSPACKAQSLRRRRAVVVRLC